MPEDRDERAAPPSPKTEAEAEERVRDDRAAENEQSTPETATTETEGGSGGEASSTAAQRRRLVTRRNALLAAAALGAVVLVAIIGVVIFYRSGQLDRLIANQIIRTLASYNIRAEIGDFRLKFSPRTVEMRNLVLYDATSGERLARIERLLATVRIEDLYALSLRRNINLESLQIDNLEAWALFNEQGLSNFRNIRLPPPDPNSRILFSYSTATLQLNNAIINYDDEQHQLSGVARNVRATVQPDTALQGDLEQAAESRMSRVELALSGSTFVYNDRPINDISVEARARVNQTRADIDELILRSPIAEARLHGTMDDWRALRYQLEVDSTVDLTQTSDVLQTGTTLRGAGQFVGKVTGEGTRYRVDGRIESDALAADNVRLKGLNVSAQASGDGASYEANGRAVAELLTAGDFQLNAVQLAGRVMGTGTDFRWVGELRSAAARSGDIKISNLILSDAAAEVRDGRITASTERVRAGTLSASDATVQGVQAQGVRVASANDRTTISASSVGAKTVTASGARVNDVTARSVVAVNQGAVTNVTAGQVRVSGLNAAGAKVGSLNIAGVRLAIRDGGGVTGSSGDVNVGTVTLADGRVEDVRLARPTFTVEPAGRYRASADLSLGGGVLGEIKLGAARSNVVATNNQVQLNNFTADILGGRAEGNATVSTGRGGTSRVAAAFDNLDIANLVAAVSGRVVPIAGRATGTADLQFPGIEVQAASGNVRAKFSGETGDDARGRTPLTGELIVEAERGLFRLQQANLRAGASELTATGSFSLERDSDLQINLASTDAGELQRVLIASGLVPEVEQTLTTYGIELAKNLRFDGRLRGSLAEPQVDGRVALDSLLVNGRELGTLTASVNATATEVRVSEGRLTEPDGGGVQFALSVPLGDNNNLALNATLERVNAANLLAAVPALNNVRAGLGEIRSDLSGRIDVTGSTDALNGSADLRFDQGRVGDIAFNEIVARATFNGSNVVLEKLEANLEAGRIAATGRVNINTNDFELQARANNIRLDLIGMLTGQSRSLPELTGTADFTANASGDFTDFSTYQVTLDGEGRDVTINGRPAGTLALRGRTEGRQLSIEFTTGLLGQPQVIAARIDLGSRGLTTTVETTLAETDLTPLFAALLPNANVKITGRATGALRISGDLFSENAEGEESFSFQGLQGTANFTELGVQIEDIQLTATSPLLVNFSGNEVVFEKTQFTGPGTDLIFGGTAALGPGGRQNLTVNGRLNLRVLNNLSPNVFLGGAAEVAVSVGGSYEQPRVNGIASVANASFSTLFGDERLSVANIQGRVRFTANQAQIESLTATLGGGQLAVTGGAMLEGLTPTRFRLSVRGDDVTVPLPQNIRATADVDLSVQGSPQTQQIIAGTVNLSRAEYTEDIDLADFINRRDRGSLTEGAAVGAAAVCSVA